MVRDDQVEGPGSPSIRGFWQAFADRQQEILDIMAGLRSGRVTELIDAALAENGLDLSYEISQSALGAELAFTPEGDPRLGRFLDEFVAYAPSLERWIISSRIQRKPISTALTFVNALHGIDLTGARIKVTSAEDRFQLCFVHEGLCAIADEQRRYAIASTFLDHALGEAIAMENVGGIEFRPSGEGIEMALLISEIIREVEGTGLHPPPGSAEAPGGEST